MRRTLTVAVALLVAVPLGACGDDDDVGGGDGAASTSIEATASEFQFDPDSWTVPAGEEFTIDFSNDGTLEH